MPAFTSAVASRSQSRQVVRSHRQRQKPINLVQAPHHHLPQRPDLLAPAQALLDSLAPPLTGLVARVIDGAASIAVEVLRHVGRHSLLPALGDEVPGVVGLVRRDGHAPSTASIGQHVNRDLALRTAVGLAHLQVHGQAVPVVGQDVSQVTRQRRRRIALAVQLRVRIAGRRVSLVAALLAAEILRRLVPVAAVLAPAALLARPSLDQRAVNAEVLARQQSALLRHLHRGIQQQSHHQPLAVLAEHE